MKADSDEENFKNIVETIKSSKEVCARKNCLTIFYIMLLIEKVLLSQVYPADSFIVGRQIR